METAFHVTPVTTGIVVAAAATVTVARRAVAEAPIVKVLRVTGLLEVKAGVAKASVVALASNATAIR
jgi:hypothetical protein